MCKAPQCEDGPTLECNESSDDDGPDLEANVSVSSDEEGPALESNHGPPPAVGCRARLCGFKARSQLNGEEVAVLRWHAPTQRWAIGKVCAGTPPWPSAELHVESSRLVRDEVTLQERLHADTRLLRRIVQACAPRRGVLS